jgi:hypothetical protein
MAPGPQNHPTGRPVRGKAPKACRRRHPKEPAVHEPYLDNPAFNVNNNRKDFFVI